MNSDDGLLFLRNLTMNAGTTWLFSMGGFALQYAQLVMELSR